MSEVVFQEFDGVNVEVVGGLVHDEEVGFRCQHHGQCHPFHFASGEVFHQTAFLESETGQELLDSQFIGEHCLVIQPVGEFLAGVQYLRKDVLLGVVFEFLFQKCYPDVFQKGNFPAGIGFVVTRKYAQQCRFSSSVRCDERNLVPFIYIESDMLEQHFRTITLADVFYL